jgi:hypothetical protein
VTGTIDQTVSWGVAEAGGGTITSGGMYTAPSAVGTYYVVVTSSADTTKSATATVTVTALAPPAVTVAISPKTATVTAGPDLHVRRCRLLGRGLYLVRTGERRRQRHERRRLYGTADSGHIPRRGEEPMTDATKSDTATITVTALPMPVAITVSPTTASIDACKTYTFRASVTGLPTRRSSGPSRRRLAGASVRRASTRRPPPAASATSSRRARPIRPRARRRP